MQSSDPIPIQTLERLRAHLHPEWGDREPIDVLKKSLLAKKLRPRGM